MNISVFMGHLSVVWISLIVRCILLDDLDENGMKCKRLALSVKLASENPPSCVHMFSLRNFELIGVTPLPLSQLTCPVS